MTHRKQPSSSSKLPDSILKRGAEASKVLEEHLERGNIIRIISHNDADGLSAAGVVARAISSMNGQFHISILSRLKKEFIKKLSGEKYSLFFFCDMGSAYLEEISRLKGDVIVADHHQPSEFEAGPHVVHINPHLHGLDGSRDLSASGTAYLATRLLNRKTAPLALVGVLGDMQYTDGFTGANRFIMEEAVEEGVLQVHSDLKLASRYTEPLYRSIAYTFNPALPGLTGDMEASMGFLENIGVSYGVKYPDLSPEERDVLRDELTGINPEIFGEVFTSREFRSIGDLSDIARVLDACGKNRKYGIGIGLCLGEREGALDVALELQKNYREELVKGLAWIRREGSTTLENLQYIYSEDKAFKGIMGTIASISLSLKILDPDIPLLGLSRMDQHVKVSARTTRPAVERGVNLGVALRDAAASFGGTGGGHDIAAGAMVPYRDMESFLQLVDEILGTQTGP